MYAHLQRAFLQGTIEASVSADDVTMSALAANRLKHASTPLASATARMLLAMGLFRLTARGLTVGPTASFSIYLPYCNNLRLATQ